MPAIHLDQLRKQVADLAQLFDYPAEFSKSLHNLFELYADRTQRSGQSGVPPPLITPYNIPPPVLKAVVREISSHVDQSPSSAFALCDHLWKGNSLEFRLLSIKILASITPSDPDPILERVSTWINTDLKGHLLTAILNDGLSRIRAAKPKIFIRLVESWLISHESYNIKVGLQALMYLVSNPEYEDISTIFRLLNPFTRKTPKQLRPDILALLQILARRFPKETAYYFRINMDTSFSEDTAWYIRHSLREFPAEFQTSLRQLLRKFNTAKSK